MVMVPEALTLDMVSVDWAKAPVAKVVAIAADRNCFFMTDSGWFEINNGKKQNKSVFYFLNTT
jgi:hypothetical protein